MACRASSGLSSMASRYSASSCCSNSTCAAIETYSPTAIEHAPATRLARPASRTKLTLVCAPATPRMSATLVTSPSLMPSTAARAAPLCTSRARRRESSTRDSDMRAAVARGAAGESGYGAAVPRKSRRWEIRLRAALPVALVVAALAAAGRSALDDLWRWFHPAPGDLLRVDFTLYYASALQGLQEGWPRLWDLTAQHAVFDRSLPGLWWFPNVYTPAMSLAMVPFTSLPLERGYLIWSSLLLAAMLGCGWLLAPGRPALRAALVALAFLPYPVTLGLRMGQVIPLQMLALALAFALLLRGHERAAGSLLVVVALKPQGLILVPFALLVAGRRKAFVAWVVAMAVVGALVLPLIGIDGARAYLQRLDYAQGHPDEFWVDWSYNLSRRFDHLPATRRLVELLAAGVALFAAFRHRARVELVLAAGLLGALLASPFLHLDDLMLLFPAGWLVLRAVPSVWTALPLLAVYGFMVSCNRAGQHIAGRWLLLCEVLWLLALALLPRRAYAPGLNNADSEGSAASFGESSGSFSGQAMPISGSSQRRPISSARS
jgi:hypothetical protein